MRYKRLRECAVRSNRFNVDVPVSVLLDKKLRPTDKIVWEYLLWRWGKDKKCYPSIRTIARDLHLDKETVVISIARLRRLRYLTVRKNYEYHRQRNTYTIKLRPAAKAVTRAQRPVKAKAPALGDKLKRKLDGRARDISKKQDKPGPPADEKKTTKDKERQVQNGTE